MQTENAVSTTSERATELIPTRESLLYRLRNWSDQESWRDFFDTYWQLLYNTARKAGLNDAEAQDAVQETVISVMKSMPKFEYRHTNSSFKSWLLQTTRWRIVDQLRKRNPMLDPEEALTAVTVTEEDWAAAWDRTLLDAAIERVKQRVDPKMYQIFDLAVYKEWSVSRIARGLKVSAGRVYLAKHRISKLLKKEVRYLQTVEFAKQ
jgi:RNA polymerase sigma-70 factor (ECF subfamily)